MMNKEAFFEKYLKQGDVTFPYMLLDRMRSDCEYYLNVEIPNHCPKEYNHLWADHDPEAQITYMRYIWEYLPEKPEWLTMEQIDEYGKRMKEACA